MGSKVPEFESWNSTKKMFCSNTFFIFTREFALARDIVLDPSHAKGILGGEDLEDVLNQKESDEYFTFTKGFFLLPCDSIEQSFSRPKNYLNTWLKMISNNSYYEKKQNAKINKQFTLAFTRFEYANLFHTTTNIYNAFLSMIFFKKEPEETSILLVDGHPKGSLDVIWPQLFNKVTRIGSIKDLTQYKELVWVELGYNSPMRNQKAANIPLAEEFREFFLEKHGVDPKGHELDCSSVNVLFIWRRDYVAHPRNPRGKVSRKIKNEKELVNYVKSSFKNVNVKDYQLDKLSMSTQLSIITETDILIGMHGAGLTHTMFLPKHAGLLEFFPKYSRVKNRAFQAIARFRNLYYEYWHNKEAGYEYHGDYTAIPVSIVAQKLQSILKKMECKY